MKELGVVLKTKNNMATVRIGRHSACGECGRCGMGENQKHVDFTANNNINASVGDTVQIEIPEASKTKLAVIAYLIPLIFGLLFLGLGFLINLPEWAIIIMFFAGLISAFLIIMIVDKKKNHKWMETPVILAVVNKTTISADSVEQEAIEQEKEKQ